MKYITTDKHPDLKEGVIFRRSLSRNDMYVSDVLEMTYFPSFDFDILLEKGYIKEVEEKEFTKSDMIGFHFFATEYNKIGETKEGLEDYIKQKSAKSNQAIFKEKT